MTAPSSGHQPGYRWRSSNFLVIACIACALFTENFLFSFIVPILDYMLEQRLDVDRSNAQYITSLILSIHALVCVIVGPITGHFADRISTRKGPLLVSLLCELVGTTIVAAAPSVTVLVCGRIILAIGGNAAWIIGLATLADTVGPENSAKTLGAISVLYNSGLLVGPMVSGWLLRLVGYWPTWSTAIAVLVIDMAMRLLIIEKPKTSSGIDQKYSKSVTYSDRGVTSPSGSIDEEASSSDQSCSQVPDETCSLLQSQSTYSGESATISSQRSEIQDIDEPRNFYRVMLSHPRALTAMACHMASAFVVTSLDTTLPLHVIRHFGWDTARTSFMFFLIQIPQLFLVTPMGALKDKYGTKIPTGIGYISTGFLLWLLGTAGKDGLPVIGTGYRGQTVYSTTLFVLGFARSLTLGTGILEITNVVREIENRNHGFFGPNGGYSRAYSLTNLSWNIGLLAGPLLSGGLVQRVGYYYMNFTFGVITLVVGLASFVFLHQK